MGIEERKDPTVSVSDLGNDVFQIDTVQSGYDGITAAYLIRGERPCLVETGTATSAPTVIKALASLGIEAYDLKTIVVSHIHLDHAGGAGDVSAAFPSASLHVHERGARHLVDPSRLLASSRRVFGSLMEILGELLPTPAERVVALSEDRPIDLGGGRFLESFNAPGHASHHVGLFDSQTGDLYVGDAAGIYIPETGDVRPATAPPEFDFHLAQETLAKFSARAPQRLLFSHYGPVDAVEDVLDRSREETERLISDVRESRLHQHDLEHAVQMVLDRTRERLGDYYSRPELIEKFESLNSTAANIAGINRWLNSVESLQFEFEDPGANH
jgi:glyoxylase-like metal-dependent hydrolase (beta-lactamase superfamily II)